MIKATRNGIETFFSDADWKTGQPQRYGWVERGAAALKTIPKEIIDFVAHKAEIKKETPKEEPVKSEPVKAEKEVKPKKDKKDGDTEPKDGKTRNRRPPAVGKT